jgi:1,4-alpha-glucan branching enzyme
MTARTPTAAYHNRYSSRRMEKPITFICHAPQAGRVTLSGDFNDWHPSSHSMKRQPDGSWLLQVPLHHGHHHYVFLVDGQPALDPKAHGIARNGHNERVSLLAVS